MEITANLVKDLREKTGAGMMDCKKALTETSGDFDKAIEYLRKKGMRLMPWADVAVPSLASGLAITRIGCYLFGCDYGAPTDAAWAMPEAVRTDWL